MRHLPHRTHHSHRKRRPRSGFTILETLLVATIIGILTGVAIPRTRYAMDRIAVNNAASDAAGLLELARQLAMTRGGRVSVDIDSAPARITVRSGLDTIRRRDEQAMHGVHFAPKPLTGSLFAAGPGIWCVESHSRHHARIGGGDGHRLSARPRTTVT